MDTMKRFAGKLKRILLICLCIIALGLASIYHFVTYTPYGRIDFSSAVVLRIVNFLNEDRSAFDYKPEEFRRMMDDIMIRNQGKLISIEKVEDRKIPWSNREIPIRVYTPMDKDKLPIILFLHGGGYISGSIETHENLCRKLAKETSAIVVSVGYSLAPEAKFPTPIEEGYAVLNWIEKNAVLLNANQNKIIIAGDSAGATTATAVCMKNRDLSGPAIALQILFYPATDVSSFNTPSHKKFGKGYFLTTESMEWAKSLYLRNEEDVKHPYASPLLADDLTNLPPSIIFTAQFDPISSEGEAYAKKLKEVGNDSQHVHVKGVLHGFASLTNSPKAQEAFKLVAQRISLL